MAFRTPFSIIYIILILLGSVLAVQTQLTSLDDEFLYGSFRTLTNGSYRTDAGYLQYSITDNDGTSVFNPATLSEYVIQPAVRCMEHFAGANGRSLLAVAYNNGDVQLIDDKSGERGAVLKFPDSGFQFDSLIMQVTANWPFVMLALAAPPIEVNTTYEVQYKFYVYHSDDNLKLTYSKSTDHLSTFNRFSSTAVGSSTRQKIMATRVLEGSFAALFYYKDTPGLISSGFGFIRVIVLTSMSNSLQYHVIDGLGRSGMLSLNYSCIGLQNSAHYTLAGASRYAALCLDYPGGQYYLADFRIVISSSSPDVTIGLYRQLAPVPYSLPLSTYASSLRFSVYQDTIVISTGVAAYSINIMDSFKLQCEFNLPANPPLTIRSLAMMPFDRLAIGTRNENTNYLIGGVFVVDSLNCAIHHHAPFLNDNYASIPYQSRLALGHYGGVSTIAVAKLGSISLKFFTGGSDGAIHVMNTCERPNFGNYMEALWYSDELWDGKGSIEIGCTPCTDGRVCMAGIMKKECDDNMVETSTYCVAKDGLLFDWWHRTVGICPENKACVNNGMISPVTCGEGYYQANNSNNYVPIGASRCLPCLNGHYCTGEAPIPCNLNYYQPSIGATSCIECPTNSSTTNRTGMSYCLVDVGFYAIDKSTTATCQAGNSCPGGCFPNAGCTEKPVAIEAPCRVDYYQPSPKSNTCFQCPSNTSTNNRTGQTYCIVNQGYYYNSITDKIVSCEAGHSCAGGCMPNTGCTEKPVAVSEACEVNYYQPNKTSSTCLECPANSSTTNRTGMTYCLVLPGYYVDNDEIVACEPGYICEGGCTANSKCTEEPIATRRACYIDEYQPSEKSTWCLQCPSNTSTNNRTGQTYCIVNQGYYYDSITDKITSCEAGYSCAGGCMPNTGCTEKPVAVSEACATDYYQPNKTSSTCLECPANSTTSGRSGMTYCLVNPGFYATDKETTATCQAGHSCLGGCFPNTGCTEKSVAVEAPCQVDYYQPNSEANTCFQCPSNTSTNNRMSMSYCVVDQGYYYNNTTDKIVSCDVGHSCAGGCLPNTGCTEKPVAISEACEVNHYQPNKTSSICLECHANTSTSEGRLGMTYCLVNPGHYVDTSDNVVSCEAGHKCAGGCYPNSNCTEKPAAVETACTLGTYQSLTGQSTCLDVLPGHYGYPVATPSTQHLECPKGHYCPGGPNPPHPCPADQYQPETKQENCLTVPAGTYRYPLNTEGATAAVECEAGFYCLGKDTPKKPCTIGEYQDEKGKTSCKTVPAGYHGVPEAALAAHSITECPEGHLCKGGAGPRTACPIGQYQNKKGQTDCSKVQPGYYGSPEKQYGATDQLKCPAGYICTGDGLRSQCVNAGTKPTYQDQEGQTVCKPCSDNQNYSQVVNRSASTCNYCSLHQYLVNGVCTDCSGLRWPSYCHRIEDSNNVELNVFGTCSESGWLPTIYECRECKSDETCTDGVRTWKFKPIMDPETTSGKILIVVVVVVLVILAVLAFWLAYYLRHKGLSRRHAGANAKVEAQAADMIQV